MSGLCECLLVERHTQSRYLFRWSLTGVLRQAFKAIGAVEPKHSKATMPSLTCIAGVSLVAAHETLMGLKSWSNLICNSERPTKFVIVQRCFDSTPSKMSFGSLASKLALVARYYHLTSAGDWQLLGFDEYRKATKSRSFKHGSLEMLAQTLTARWGCPQGDFRVNVDAKLTRPPLIAPD